MKKLFTILGGISIVALFTISFTSAYTQEQIEAYQWAYKYKLTTQPTIEEAKMNSPLTRQAFAKMVINYLENVIGIKKAVSNSCYFPDESKITKDLIPYTKKTCNYQIMGSNGKNFNPTQTVDRAQLGTVISRILWGEKYNVSGKQYYINHLNALKENEIMNKIDNPKSSAKRGDVMIMLKRLYEKYGSNISMNGNNVAIYNNVNTTSPLGKKTSLTNDELDELVETHFPKGYTFTIYNVNENTIGDDEGKIIYPENISHTLLIPEHTNMINRKIISSEIRGDMILTETEVTLQDGATIRVFYTVDPVTLNFIGAQAGTGYISTHYEFFYDINEIPESEENNLETIKNDLDKYNYTTYEKGFRFDDGYGYPFPSNFSNTDEIITYYNSVRKNLANLIGYINVENPSNDARARSSGKDRMLEVSKKYIQLIDEVIQDTKNGDTEKCSLDHVALKKIVIERYEAKDGGCHNESCKMVSGTEDSLIKYYNDQKN